MGTMGVSQSSCTIYYSCNTVTREIFYGVLFRQQVAGTQPTIILLLALSLIKLLFISFLQTKSLSLIVLFAWLLADIFTLFITLFSASLIIQVVLSWITPP